MGQGKEVIMVDETALTKEQWDELTPKQKGYACYFQGEWNPVIPNRNPFPIGTKEHGQFVEGEQAAVIACIDSEE